MYLKQLTLSGFKSFASKTNIVLEPGITCIFGPNGSGKSNIVDALAWVMGEQGAKTLRGSKMDDVIFAGSAGKTHQLGRAEVSLTIDNSDQKLPIEYNEVTIKRIMFRGGGSEYEINGNKCRLLDIQDLLSDTGLGSNMHVIVGQGRLDTILNATPIDRRGFIEEAAGVLKHRKRKEKAVRKLDNMQTKLMRLADLTAEVRRQLGPLGRQADIAARANTIQSDVRDAKSRLLADDFVQLQNANQTDSQKIEELKKQAAEQNKILEEKISLVQELEQQLSNAQTQKASDDLYKLNSLKEKFINLAKLATERENLLTQVELLFEGQDPDSIAANRDQSQKEFEDAEKKLQELEKNLQEYSENRQKIEENVQTLSRRVQIIQQNSSERRANIATINAKISSLNERIDESKTRQKVVAEAKKEAEKNLEQLQEEHDILQKSFDDKNRTIEKLKENVQKFKQDRSEIQTYLDDIQGRISQTTQEIAVQEATQETLQQELERKVGNGAKLNIDKLTSSFSKSLQSQIDSLSKEIGKEFLVASDEKLANYISELVAGFKVVTPKGEVIYYDTENNSKVDDENVFIPVKDKINQSKKLADKLRKELSDLEKDRNKVSVQLSQKKDEFQEVNDELSRKERELRDLESQIKTGLNRKDSSERDVAKNAQQLKDLQNSEKNRKEEISELQNNLEQIKNEPETSSEALQTAIDVQAKAEIDLRKARDLEQETAQKVASNKSKNYALKERVVELSRQYDGEVKAREEAKKQKAIKQEKAAVARKVQEQVKKVLEKIDISIENAAQIKQQLIIEQTSQNSQLSDLRAEIRNLRQNLEQTNNQLHQIEIKTAGLDEKITALKERIDSELDIPVNILVNEFGPDKPILTPNPDDEENPIEVQYNRSEQEKRLKKAEKDLARLGKVNPLALEEYEALEERHKYLTDQLEDLDKSKAEVLTMIDDIDKLTISAFTSAYEDTAKAFQDVFTILFPGGKGYMELTDPENPLTTGIEIHAQPAGKRVSRLSLLSGGERSLVAVAMLVAIFKSRPSPFYVMDEVEAALDDVNLSRLLKIFKELKANSQLLIVTHQKRTMEIGDALYGITMRKDGITQVISQKLEN
ncbi:MAG: AAA family ATPase [Candidatus Ancillula sp.]|jgi:chromosome segregation protein|nr:AAA family ATPase [Candidatus Ancillula sp.]